MDQHVGSFVVCIVGNQEARRDGRLEGGVIGVQCFEELGGLEDGNINLGLWRVNWVPDF